MATISNVTNETKVVKKLKKFIQFIRIIFMFPLKLKVRYIFSWSRQRAVCYFIISRPFNTRTKKSFFRLGKAGRGGLIPSQDVNIYLKISGIRIAYLGRLEVRAKVRSKMLVANEISVKQKRLVCGYKSRNN